MTVARIRAEQMASQKNMIDTMLTELRSQPRAPAQTIVHQTATTNDVLNQPVQAHFTAIQDNLTQNVHHVHQTAMNFVQNNANKAINMAVQAGTTLANAYGDLLVPQSSSSAASSSVSSPPSGCATLISGSRSSRCHC